MWFLISSLHQKRTACDLPLFKKDKSEFKLFFTSYCLYVVSKVLVVYVHPTLLHLEWSIILKFGHCEYINRIQGTLRTLGVYFLVNASPSKSFDVVTPKLCS